MNHLEFSLGIGDAPATTDRFGTGGWHERKAHPCRGPTIQLDHSRNGNELFRHPATAAATLTGRKEQQQKTGQPMTNASDWLLCTIEFPAKQINQFFNPLPRV
jgi:hypothetical protein